MFGFLRSFFQPSPAPRREPSQITPDDLLAMNLPVHQPSIPDASKAPSRSSDAQPKSDYPLSRETPLTAYIKKSAENALAPRFLSAKAQAEADRLSAQADAAHQSALQFLRSQKAISLSPTLTEDLKHEFAPSKTDPDDPAVDSLRYALLSFLEEPSPSSHQKPSSPAEEVQPPHPNLHSKLTAQEAAETDLFDLNPTPNPPDLFTPDRPNPANDLFPDFHFTPTSPSEPAVYGNQEGGTIGGIY